MAKQITIISGKGGTGKTTFTSALAYLTKDKAVFADADVDAPDLHLILHPTILTKEKLFISKKVVRNEDLCTRCNKCGEFCKFNAINAETVFYHKCEGCGLCTKICPEEALTLEPVLSATLYKSTCRFGDFVHAEMVIGEGSSGRIVDAIRKKAKLIAEEKSLDFIIIDGSPGIGCPVIASITGVDLVLVIVEPTLSGIHDLERVLDMAHHFGIPALVCINKYDVNMDNTKKIERFCNEKGIVVVGKLPYDTVMTKAMINQKNIIEFSDGKVSHEIRVMWNKIQEMIEKA